MKSLILTALFLVSPSVFAIIVQEAPKPVTCESLLAKVNVDCEEVMCEDAVLSGEVCVHDGDFMEEFQTCVAEDFLAELEVYNIDHPAAKLFCPKEK